MLGAVMFGHRAMQPVIDAIIRLAEKAAKEPRDLPVTEDAARSRKHRESRRRAISKPPSRSPRKHVRRDRIAEIRKAAAAQFVGEGEGKIPEKQVQEPVPRSSKPDVMRFAVLDTSRRIDGRDLKTVRPIVAEVGILPRTHGSALFTRGETQALVVATLGTGEDEQYRRLARRHLQAELHAAL